MTRLIRGKIVPRRPTNAVSAGTALSSTGESTVIEHARPEFETETEVVEELNPYRDGLTFAPSTAPWVGAEQAWRSGTVPPPHEDWVNYKTRIDSSDTQPSDDLTLTDIEVAAVLSTLPPPASSEQPSTAKGGASQLLKYAAVAAFTAVSALAVFGSLSGSKADIPQSETISPASMAEFGRTVALPATTETEASEASEELLSAASVAPAIEEPTPKSAAKKTFHRRQNRAVVSAPEASVTAPEESSNEVSEVENAVSTVEENEAEEPAVEKTAFNVSNPYMDDMFGAEQSAPKPSALSREAVREVMDSIAPQVSKCALGGKGKLILKVEVSGATGRVVQASAVNAPFANSSVGFCAARAVRFAKFPKFDQDAVTIKYPFDL